MLGTLAYIAPEQAQDARFVLPAADLYSAGATLYYLLAGQPPYQFSSSAERTRDHRRERSRAPDRHRPDLPAGTAGGRSEGPRQATRGSFRLGRRDAFRTASVRRTADSARLPPSVRPRGLDPR